jgi:hypothetical protein
MKKRARTLKNIQGRPTVRLSQLAKSWLMAQPAFQRMMLSLAERFAEHIVANFDITQEPVLADMPDDMTFGEWLGPSGHKLYYWNKCDDDILGDHLLAAVR